MDEKLTLPIEVGKKYLNRAGEIVKCLGRYDDSYNGAVCDLSNNTKVWEFNGRCSKTDDHYEIDIVADYDEEKEYILNFNKKEILQAIHDDKPLQFRVDDGEEWDDVVDTDWVLRLIADKTQWCFRVTPPSIEISDGTAFHGDKVWWHCNRGPEQVTLDESSGFHWSNAIEGDHAKYYSIKEPEFEIKKVYKYMEK